MSPLRVNGSSSMIKLMRSKCQELTDMSLRVNKGLNFEFEIVKGLRVMGFSSIYIAIQSMFLFMPQEEEESSTSCSTVRILVGEVVLQILSPIKNYKTSSHYLFFFQRQFFLLFFISKESFDTFLYPSIFQNASSITPSPFWIASSITPSPFWIVSYITPSLFWIASSITPPFGL